MEPLLKHLDARGLTREPGRPEPECRFWSRRDGTLNLQHFRPGEDVSYEPHTHSEYVIVICLAGAVTKRQLGRNWVIGPGEAMIGNFGVEHASAYLHDAHPCEAVCVTVDPRALAPLLEGFHLPRMTRDAMPVFLGKLANPVIQACGRDIAQELCRRDLGHDIVLNGLAMRALVESLRAWPRAGVERCAVDLTPRLPRHEFVRAYEFMRWCRKDAFRLARLCQFLGTSEERFTRLFLAATHATPANFYNQMLLEHARILLHDPALSVKEVSALLGFKTSSHFVMAFRRRFGRPPQEYRVAGEGAGTAEASDRFDPPMAGPCPGAGRQPGFQVGLGFGARGSAS